MHHILLLFIGNRNVRIRKYTDNQHYCPNCHSYGLTVKVYKKVFHAFYIPMIPDGPKTVSIHCNNCGAQYHNEAVKKEYASTTRIPFYVFSGLIVVACVVVWGIFSNIKTGELTEKYVADPLVGDVYQIKNGTLLFSSYYFLRIMKIQDSTVLMYQNNLVYRDNVWRLDDKDFFVKDQFIYHTKATLQQMLEDGEILFVERNYDNDYGFNRIK